MITPDKYLNLKSSLINVSAFAVRALQNIKVLSYTEIEIEIERALGEEARQILPYSLNFLFLVGKIDYNKEIDSLSLKHETEQNIQQ